MFDVNKTIRVLLNGIVNKADSEQIISKVSETYNEGRVLNIKIGLDPSAPDIHLGHAVILRRMKQLQDLGHNIIIIIGDFTGMIGDPTGKSKMRKQLTKVQVLENAKTYYTQIFKIIDPNKTTIRFNSEWFDQMSLRDVIELCSKTTVARMLERDDFSTRYKRNIPVGLHEFLYPLLQAYDSVAVHADIEMGGTDQTFNITMGKSIQKDYQQKQQVAIFMPLLEGFDGKEKMSKSLGNYIGIDESPFDMYVKIMKIPDSLIIKYFELATDMDPSEIDSIRQCLTQGNVNPRDIKMLLAREIISLYHSQDSLMLAEGKFKAIYQRKDIDVELPALIYSEDDLDANGQLSLIDLLYSTGVFKSRTEIRNLIKQGAVRINQNRVCCLTFYPEKDLIIQVGKGKIFKLSEREIQR